MNSAFLLFCENDELSKLQTALMILLVALAGVYVAGLWGLLSLVGSVGFCIREEAKADEKEIKKESKQQSGREKRELSEAKENAKKTRLLDALLALIADRFNADSELRRIQALPIPHPALSARLYPAPTASFA